MPRADDVVDEWNHDYDPGQPVQVRTGKDQYLYTVTRSTAFLLGGHTPCIYVDAQPSLYQLSRVTPLKEEYVRPA